MLGRILLTVAMLVAAVPSAEARARRYYYAYPPPWIRPKPVRGTFGISGFGAIVARQDGGVEYLHHGGGGAMWGGIELGRVVGIEAKYAVSLHNPVRGCGAGPGYVWCDASYLFLQTLSLDLKLHIPTDTRVVPYAVIGPMFGWIGRPRDLSDTIGGGFEAGGGLDIWFTRQGAMARSASRCCTEACSWRTTGRTPAPTPTSAWSRSARRSPGTSEHQTRRGR
jgi:hypothetical protein